MQSKKLNVLFIPSWYPNLSNPTLGIFIRRQAEALSKLHSITVINVLSDSSINKCTVNTENKNGITTISAHYKKSNSSVIKLFRSLHAFKLAYTVYLKNSAAPNIVHLHVIFPAAVYILFTSFFKKIPLVISEHWSGYMEEDGNYKGFFLRKISEAAARKAKKIIVVSSPMKKAMLKHNLGNEKKYCIVNNAVDTNLFYATEKTSSPLPFTFIHVSSMNDREKNISGIIRVAAEFSKQNKNFILNFIGTSNEFEGFRKQANDAGLLNKILFFKGELPSEKVAEEMRNADAFLMFSNYEGQPCVILESLMCGTPVIASHTGGIPEVVNNSNGLLVKPNDEAALLTAMQSMTQNIALYNRSKIANDAKQKYSYEVVATQLNEVYNNAIEQR